jgi:hypothetical protein
LCIDTLLNRKLAIPWNLEAPTAATLLTASPRTPD